MTTRQPRKNNQYGDWLLNVPRVQGRALCAGYFAMYKVGIELGMSPSRFSEALRGIRQPLDFVEKLAALLNTTPEDIVEGRAVRADLPQGVPTEFFVVPEHLATAMASEAASRVPSKSASDKATPREEQVTQRLNPVR